MNEIVNKISYAMSLREPQKEALSYLDAISENSNFKTNSKTEVEDIATQNCKNKNVIKVADEFDFPSFCYSMATGIGKTRLMGASIYYLYKTKGYKHFFILAPGNTIYDKLRKEALPHNPKYMFKGLEADMGRPKVYDGENYTLYRQLTLAEGRQSEIQLFIFNIGKIFNSRTDSQFNFHKYQEMLGSSFADVLAGFDDLVICMDEAHRYYAPASMKAINYLKPILGLEFTATPKNTNRNIIYSYDITKGAGKYLKIPMVIGRTNMGGYSADDIEEMKIRDGLTLHENRKSVVYKYCTDNGKEYIKPIVLIACKDTEHAKKVRTLIDNENFNDGKYRGRVIEIHSNMTGEESEENIKKLLSVEGSDNSIEIVIHVYKLKEGWDVNNLFTIIPLNAAKSDILALQTIGRGLRLPFGYITGNEEIDTLDIVAHEHYREIVDDIRNNEVFKYRNLDTSAVEKTETVNITSGFDDGQLSLLDQVFETTQMKSFASIKSEKTQEDLYKAYVETFAASQKTNLPKSEQSDQISLFAVSGDEVIQNSDTNIQTEIKAHAPAMKKDEFIAKIKEYGAKAISVPKVLVSVSSQIELTPIKIKRNIADFEVAASKIERYDAINKQLLSSVDASLLEVDDPLNMLACMLLDSVDEFSSDDADYIIDIVEQYLSLIDDSYDEKKKIVRRYASVIINDITTQVLENMKSKTFYTYLVQKDLILFGKFVKNIKPEGTIDFRKSIDDKSNIRKYLFKGYKKSYYPENGFDSDPERVFSVILEEDDNVERWIKPPLNQLGLFWQAGVQYNPDFLVETKDSKFMVEVKAANEIKNVDVLAKAQEGIKWCKYATIVDPDKKKWEYRLIADTNIKQGNTCKYSLGLAESIQEEG